MSRFVQQWVILSACMTSGKVGFSLTKEFLSFSTSVMGLHSLQAILIFYPSIPTLTQEVPSNMFYSRLVFVICQFKTSVCVEKAFSSTFKSKEDNKEARRSYALVNPAGPWRRWDSTATKL